MITDRIEYLETYKSIPALEQVTDFIKSHDLTALPEGRYDIAGDKLFLNIQVYETKDPAKARLEAHDRYIDLQLMIEGEEIIGYAPRAGLSDPTEIQPENDISFYDAAFDGYLLKKSMFGVYFPQDAHAPCISSDKTRLVKKAVFKILYE